MDKLGIHLKYFCGETAERTAAQALQRRSSDRPQQHGKNKRKTTAMTKTKKKSFGKQETTKKFFPKPKKTFPKTKPKKVIRAIPTKGYESDSDLSLPDDFDVNTKRPSRSAAKTAPR